jgi:hypothetical protein
MCESVFLFIVLLDLNCIFQLELSDRYQHIFHSDFIVFKYLIILILTFPFPTCQTNMKTEMI